MNLVLICSRHLEPRGAGFKQCFRLYSVTEWGGLRSGLCHDGP